MPLQLTLWISYRNIINNSKRSVLGQKHSKHKWTSPCVVKPGGRRQHPVRERGRGCYLCRVYFSRLHPKRVVTAG